MQTYTVERSKQVKSTVKYSHLFSRSPFFLKGTGMQIVGCGHEWHSVFPEKAQRGKL